MSCCVRWYCGTESAWSCMLFVMMLLYFPAKPPAAPSISATVERVDFFSGLKRLLQYVRSSMLCRPISLLFNFCQTDPCCHGNKHCKFQQKIGYNTACNSDTCVILAPNQGVYQVSQCNCVSEILPDQLLLPWQ